MGGGGFCGYFLQLAASRRGGVPAPGRQKTSPSYEGLAGKIKTTNVENYGASEQVPEVRSQVVFLLPTPAGTPVDLPAAMLLLVQALLGAAGTAI